MKVINFLKKNYFKIIFFIIIIINLILVYFTYTIKQENKKLNQNLTEKKQIIANYKKNEKIKKYMLAENLYNNNLYWYEILNKLLQIYNQTLVLQNNDLKIQNLQIQTNELKFIGKTSNRKNIYKKNWFISKLAKENFIETINIPLYQKQNEEIIFNLNAKLNINGKNTK